MPPVRTLPLACWLLLLVIAPLGAQELTGRWVLAVELDAGSGEATFDLQQHGDSVVGTYSGVLGQAVRVTGMIHGDDVEFAFDSEAGKITFSGQISGATMKGTCDYGLLGGGTFTGRKVAAARGSPTRAVSRLGRVAQSRSA